MKTIVYDEQGGSLIVEPDLEKGELRIQQGDLCMVSVKVKLEHVPSLILALKTTVLAMREMQSEEPVTVKQTPLVCPQATHTLTRGMTADIPPKR